MKISELLPETKYIKVDGVEYELKYNMYAMCELEKHPVNDKIPKILSLVFESKEDKSIKSADLIDFIYSGLVGAGKGKSLISKETFFEMSMLEIGSMVVNACMSYVDTLPIPEQVNKLEVIESQSTSKKKVVK